MTFHDPDNDLRDEIRQMVAVTSSTTHTAEVMGLVDRLVAGADTLAPSETDRCVVHGSHRPVPLLLHVHHVQPQGMGGPDIPSNKVVVCPTGHFNIHTVMAALVFGKPVPKATLEERHLAEVGHQMWVDAGKPGNPHAAYGLV